MAHLAFGRSARLSAIAVGRRGGLFIRGSHKTLFQTLEDAERRSVHANRAILAIN